MNTKKIQVAQTAFDKVASLLTAAEVEAFRELLALARDNEEEDEDENAPRRVSSVERAMKSMLYQARRD